MDSLTESVRTLDGNELRSFASVIGNNDKLSVVLSELVKCGGVDDYLKIAELLTYITVDGKNSADYYSVRYGSNVNTTQFDAFMHAVHGMLTEKEIMPMLLYAQYAPENSELYSWNGAVDLYLLKRADEDFSTVADYIDKYDPEYAKYSILFETNMTAAVSRLMEKLLYGKHVNKAAIRRVLMTRAEIADGLIDLYRSGDAKERAAIVRVLLMFKNNDAVNAFLQGVVKSEKSKTVREIINAPKTKKIQNSPADFFESMMISGETMSIKKWQNLLSKQEFAVVADKLFFIQKSNDGERVLVFDNGAFLDTDNNPINTDCASGIGVLHPIELPRDSGLLSLKIDQPFRQIDRPIYYPAEGERYSLNRLSGTIISQAEFTANVKKFGFKPCSSRGATLFVLRYIGEYVIAAECEKSDSMDSVTCLSAAVYNADSVVKVGHATYIDDSPKLSLTDLPPRMFSELILCVYELFGRADNAR